MAQKRVVVFDDDLDLLDIFKFLFEEKDWEVHTFNNCADIINKVKEVSPDLIVMDNWIPPTGGMTATQIIKTDDQLKTIPVIYVSANNDIKDLAAKAGSDAYLPKPFEFRVLQEMAEQLLNNIR